MHEQFKVIAMVWSKTLRWIKWGVGEGIYFSLVLYNLLSPSIPAWTFHFLKDRF